MQFVRQHPVIAVVSISLMGGIVGFVGGIAWCRYDYPSSPQAPLFGMFITGPAGLVIGFVASLTVAIRASSSNGGKNGAA
jgi:hypothetical protein